MSCSAGISPAACTDFGLLCSRWPKRTLGLLGIPLLFQRESAGRLVPCVVLSLCFLAGWQSQSAVVHNHFDSLNAWRISRGAIDAGTSRRLMTLRGDDTTPNQIALLIRLRDGGGCQDSAVLRGPDVIVLIRDGLAFIENGVVCVSEAGRELLRQRSRLK